MHTRSTFVALVLVTVTALAADRILEAGWSSVVVRVIDEETRRPVAGAVIETTCRGSRYEAERQTTDASGHATVPIYKSWVILRITHDGYTNSRVSIVGTNAVSSFCTNAVITMGRSVR